MPDCNDGSDRGWSRSSRMCVNSTRCDAENTNPEHDVEKPLGQWNRLECICKGGSITNILNGKIVNAATNASHRRGKILFQSEGAEVFFRRIDLLPLKD